ncbi:phage N-6-adenine-methyltransferase [Escherichia coli]|uniref:phage N-6-adenine-methyltransferase n=1 Tax=Escherichia coli TaxID=562 RepID=UPI001CA65738|nr:phage N-6-adenine-methyltransferase [Escherichia coli]QZY67685.1 phage N-6-adenine-methyltransferase [Escherichia coli]
MQVGLKGYAGVGAVRGGSDDWMTSLEVFDALNREFKFNLDAAASNDNALCSKFFTKETDALKQDWSVFGSVFCNPPYSMCSKFLDKATEAGVSVFLIPARTQTNYFYEKVFSSPHLHELRFVNKMMRFDPPPGVVIPDGQRAPMPLAICVFRRTLRKNLVLSYVDADTLEILSTFTCNEIQEMSKKEKVLNLLVSPDTGLTDLDALMSNGNESELVTVTRNCFKVLQGAYKYLPVDFSNSHYLDMGEAPAVVRILATGQEVEGADVAMFYRQALMNKLPALSADDLKRLLTMVTHTDRKIAPVKAVSPSEAATVTVTDAERELILSHIQKGTEAGLYPSVGEVNTGEYSLVEGLKGVINTRRQKARKVFGEVFGLSDADVKTMLHPKTRQKYMKNEHDLQDFLNGQKDKLDEYWINSQQ